MIVDFSVTAERDLEAIADYLAADNPQRALCFIQQLRQKCADLSDRARAFPLVPRYGITGLRRYTYQKYLIFYLASDERITIIHILHGAQDVAHLLQDDP